MPVEIRFFYQGNPARFAEPSKTPELLDASSPAYEQVVSSKFLEALDRAIDFVGEGWSDNTFETSEPNRKVHYRSLDGDREARVTEKP